MPPVVDQRPLEQAEGDLHAQHAGDSSVNDMTDAINCDTRLRNIRRDDDFAQRVRSKRAILLLRLQFAMQGNAGHTLLRSQAAQCIECAVDFPTTRHEDEDVPWIILLNDALDGFGRLRRD